MKRLSLLKSDAVPEGRIRLPASKSISNRLLILSHLSGGRVMPEGLSEAGDTKLMQQALAAMEKGEADLDLADAGTAMRFVTALAAITPGHWRLGGTERMYERPIAPLVEALRELGAEPAYLGKEGYPPLRVQGGALKGGKLRVRSDKSSQFLSALAMIAPRCEGGLELELEGEAVSMPYFRMTLSLLRELEVPVEEGKGAVRIGEALFPEKRIRVEGDHSAAAFWYELLSLRGKGGLFLEGIAPDSVQGDRRTPAFFHELGVQERWEEEGAWIEAVPGAGSDAPYEADMRDQPDLVPALAVALAGNGKKGILHGVSALRGKESDRLLALKEELEKVGVRVELDGDRIGIDPAGLDTELEPTFNAHNDHRIAMALAPLVAVLPGLSIEEPSVVEKSYPRFWEDLERVLPGSLRWGSE